MSNLTDFFSSGGVKSVQTGSVNVTTSGNVDVTISAVDTSKSVVFVNTAYQSSVAQEYAGYLTSTTNLRIDCRRDPALATVYWQVVEFN